MADFGNIAPGGFMRPPKINPDKLAAVSITGTEIDVGKQTKREKTSAYPLLGFTSATARGGAPHPSGWSARVVLEREGRAGAGEGARWRSGEVVSGVVELEKGEGEFVDDVVASVVVKAFCQSTSLHWVIGVQELHGKAKMVAGSDVSVDMEPFIEWNRSHLINRNDGQELWANLAPDATPNSPTHRLPFTFALPTTIAVDQASPALESSLPREALHAFRRTPPGSLPAVEGKIGAVEWTVEATVHFGPSGPNAAPAFAATNRSAALKTASFGLASSTASQLVHRVVFPFEPADADSQDLYSSWRPKTTNPKGVPVSRYVGIPPGEIDSSPVAGLVVPAFGADPRDESLGGAHVGPGGQVRSLLVEKQGGRTAWDTYYKTTEVTNLFKIKTGTIRIEGSVPHPATVARHAPSLPIILTFAYDTKKSKTAGVERIILTLVRRTRTLGGTDKAPHMVLEDLRRHELNLADLSDVSSATSGAKHLALQLEPNTVKDIPIPYDLQSAGSFNVNGETKAQHSLRDLSLSIRTPTIEMDYVLTAQVFPSQGESVFLFRVPVQVLAGDADAAPAFEAVA